MMQAVMFPEKNGQSRLCIPERNSPGATEDPGTVSGSILLGCSQPFSSIWEFWLLAAKHIWFRSRG